jgi:hypothetical protein
MNTSICGDIHTNIHSSMCLLLFQCLSLIYIVCLWYDINNDRELISHLFSLYGTYVDLFPFFFKKRKHLYILYITFPVILSRTRPHLLGLASLHRGGGGRGFPQVAEIHYIYKKFLQTWGWSGWDRNFIEFHETFFGILSNSTEFNANSGRIPWKP